MSKEGPSLDRLSMLDEVGRRQAIHPADVRGRFRRAKPWVYGTLLAIFVALPLIDIGGNPAVHIDIDRRQFFLFGSTFNAQDFFLVFVLLIGIGFTLIVVSALWGRVWCGWACPQTVLLDGIFRPIERVILGSRARRMRLAASGWSAQRVLRTGALHAVYVALAVGVTVGFLSYFMTTGGVFSAAAAGPAAHPTAWSWGVVMAAILYFDLFWFREQLCVVICPYGRLQSVLTDPDTLIIGYDRRRGEPRGKATDADVGDCVDCGRCVAVCPTGIDIRNGLQLECIGCAYCIDACDEIMDRLDRPRGLVRYDSERGLEGGTRRFWRPRVFAYLAVLGIVTTAATLLIGEHQPFAANALRVRGVPYQLAGDTVHNQLRIHVTHKGGEPSTYRVEAPEQPPLTVVLPQPEVRLESFGSHDVPVVVSVPRAELRPGLEATFSVRDVARDHTITLTVPVLGPSGPGGPPP